MKGCCISTEDLLKAYWKKGIISDSEVWSLSKEAAMTKILARVHKHKITPPKKGVESSRWSTYVQDDTCPFGRRKIAKKTEKELEAFLLEFYAKDLLGLKQSDMTFKELFYEWADYKVQFCKATNKKKSLSPSTINRYKRDYRNNIEGTELSSMKLKDITPGFLQKSLKDIIVNNHRKESYSQNLVGYVRNAFAYATRERIVSENVFLYVDADLILSFAENNAVKQDEDRILKVDEVKRLLEATRAHEAKYPYYMPDYAVELASFSGMRVGELSALQWTDIDWENGYINIDYSEHRIDYEDHSELVIDEPKCLKHRRFPIGDAIRDLFERIRSLEIDSEYVFGKPGGGRYTAHDISCACNRRAKEAGIGSTSIHRIRRTVASELRKRYSNKMVSNMMGHLEDTDENFYNYDNTSYEEKLKAVNSLYVSDEVKDNNFEKNEECNIVAFPSGKAQKENVEPLNFSWS